MRSGERCELEIEFGALHVYLKYEIW